MAFLSFLAEDFSRFFRLALFTLYMVKRLLPSVVVLYSFFEHLEPSSSEPFRSIDDNERFTSDCVVRFDRSIGWGTAAGVTAAAVTVTVVANGVADAVVIVIGDDAAEESLRFPGI